MQPGRTGQHHIIIHMLNSNLLNVSEITMNQFISKPTRYWKGQGSYILDLFIVDKNEIVLKICKFTALSSGSFCQIHRVTDEALIAETAVWPNFFLMNVFFAL